MNEVRAKAVICNVVEKSDGTSRPFIGLEDIESGTGRLVSDEPSLKAANDSLCHGRGDILFGKLRPYLAKSAMAKGPGSGTSELLVLRTRESLLPKFLLYTTLSAPWLAWANTTSYGSKMPRTSWEAMSDYQMWLPSLDEQRRIADFLDAETARIDNVLRLRAKTRELLVLKRDRIVEQILGLSHESAAQTFLPLKYLASEITVGIVITPAAWYVDSDGVPALRGLNVQPGRIVTDDLVQISREGHALNRKSRLREGDLVVVRTGQAGTAAVVPPEFDGANCIDVVIVRPVESLSPYYAEYVLNSDYARRHVTENSVGSIQSHFNVGAMKQMPIPRIPRAEQERRVKLLDDATGALDRLVSSLQDQERLLAERRQALITAAVTGQFDVSSAA